MAKFLVTGSAGFIGFHVARRLLQAGHDVLGVDNFSEYYDVALKERRNDILSKHANFRVARVGVDDMAAFGAEWDAFRPEVVIHLAAQAGVRYSIEHPESYVQANLIGTFNVLELARRTQPRHLLAASTSSVYGANTRMPFDEDQKVSHPLTFYAATKGATELMGHSYAHLFGVPTTFFRFFTVYGAWSRPDMAPLKFASAIDQGRPLDVYNRGEMVRDFTYVEDLAEAVVRLADAVPGREPVEGDSLSPVAPWRVVNIGQGTPVKLMDFIAEMERAMGKPGFLNLMPMQQGDVLATEASSELLRRLTGYAPSTPISVGVPAFVQWYREHYAA